MFVIVGETNISFSGIGSKYRNKIIKYLMSQKENNK